MTRRKLKKALEKPMIEEHFQLKYPQSRREVKEDKP